MLRSSLFLSAILLVAASFSPQARDEKPAPAARATELAKLVLVTRHCEKDTAGDPRDPGLSEAGRKRAQVLARMLKDANVAHLFTSEFKRAQETAQQACATAEKHVVSATKPDELFAALDALAGGTVALVVGHSNTTPAMLTHYGWKQTGADGKPVTAFPEDEFGALFAITVPPKGSNVAPTIVKLRYGD